MGQGSELPTTTKRVFRFRLPQLWRSQKRFAKFADRFESSIGTLNDASLPD